MERNNKNIIIFLSLLLLILLAMFNNNTRNFSEARWKNKNYINFRYNMVNDLLSNHELRGMSEKKVLKLLGKPDSIFSKIEISSFDKLMIYKLKSNKYKETELIITILNKKVIRVQVK
jgi:hypothetical protein